TVTLRPRCAVESEGLRYERTQSPRNTVGLTQPRIRGGRRAGTAPDGRIRMRGRDSVQGSLLDRSRGPLDLGFWNPRNRRPGGYERTRWRNRQACALPLGHAARAPVLRRTPGAPRRAPGDPSRRGSGAELKPERANRRRGGADLRICTPSVVLWRMRPCRLIG